jgi:uncharacterized membrane protein YebE (DUF533 family)
MKFVHLAGLAAIAAIVCLALSNMRKTQAPTQAEAARQRRPPQQQAPSGATDLYVPQIDESNGILSQHQGSLFALHPSQFENKSDF